MEEQKFMVSGQEEVIKEKKIKEMKELLKKKFENPQFRKLLLDTYPHELIEGNNWGDTYWGKCNGHGKNMLGTLLMQIRSELRGEGW